MLCADIALRSGMPATGSCNMTMPLLTGLSAQMNFWRNRTFCPSHTLPTPLTLLHATFSSSHNWRKQWKVTDSMTLKRFKPTRQDKQGLLQKVTTRVAFVSGRNAGISAYKHKDTTLKETRPTSRQVYSFTHKKISPGNKWSVHVHVVPLHALDDCPLKHLQRCETCVAIKGDYWHGK